MLAENLKILLASTFSYYIKSSFFHWNLTGPGFPSYHKLFGKIYEGAQESVDKIAEEIRTLRSNAPGSLYRYQELTRIQDQTQIPKLELMIEELLSDTNIMIDLLNECFQSAESENKQDIANYMAELIEFYSKYRWQLESCIQEEEQDV